MLNGQKIIVIMPAYNAEATLKKTHEEVLASGIVDHVIVVDDASSDRTIEIATMLPETTFYRHKQNQGYGGNQKTCYRLALVAGADIVIMVHPDYQYTPRLIPAMASLISNGLYHCVLGSRILGGYSLNGGMPVWKYVANRFLTMIENLLTGAKLSEYHTGYRAFSRALLEMLPLDRNSNDYLFDNQMLLQILWKGFQIAEITCPTKYFPEASSINFTRSLIYGYGCLVTAMKFRMMKMHLVRSSIFLMSE